MKRIAIEYFKLGPFNSISLLVVGNSVIPGLGLLVCGLGSAIVLCDNAPLYNILCSGEVMTILPLRDSPAHY